MTATQTTTNPAPKRISATQYIVPSRTQEGVNYSVVNTPDGWECSCPNAFAKVPNCWHLRSVREAEAKRRDSWPCTARPAKPMPDPALGLFLLAGGNMGKR